MPCVQFIWLHLAARFGFEKIFPLRFVIRLFICFLKPQLDIQWVDIPKTVQPNMIMTIMDSNPFRLMWTRQMFWVTSRLLYRDFVSPDQGRSLQYAVTNVSGQSKPLRRWISVSCEVPRHNEGRNSIEDWHSQSVSQLHCVYVPHGLYLQLIEEIAVQFIPVSKNLLYRTGFVFPS